MDEEEKEFGILAVGYCLVTRAVVFLNRETRLKLFGLISTQSASWFIIVLQVKFQYSRICVLCIIIYILFQRGGYKFLVLLTSKLEFFEYFFQEKSKSHKKAKLFMDICLNRTVSNNLKVVVVGRAFATAQLHSGCTAPPVEKFEAQPPLNFTFPALRMLLLRCLQLADEN